MYLSASGIVVACARSCICVLVESLLPVIGHVFVCLLNRCGLWSVMYLCACWIAVACDRSCINMLVESLHTNTWPITGTTIQQAHKYMNDHRQQRFNKHTNTWTITDHNGSTSRQIHDHSQATTIIVHVFVCLLNRCSCYRSCICVLVESLWPVIGHVFVCLLNRCGLWSVMCLCACRSQATAIPLADKYMTDNRPQRFNKHTNTWPITGHNDSTSTQIQDRSQLNRCGLSSVMYLCACWIVVASDRSCIRVLVESLWPVNGHVFVC
jgi:hypothetical protein